MIDIIIPAYNAEKTIKQTLSSIATQSIANLLNIYIVDDCSKKKYDDLITTFNKYLNVKILKLKKNSGPGVARQYGIDNSNGKYIIFIDSDDTFYDTYSVETLYNEIESDNQDIVIGSFVEETETYFSDHTPGYTWLHGKIFRREFLEQNNIRFNDTRANEDTGFNHLCYICNAKIKDLDQKVYIWRNNNSSLTRKENHSYQESSVKPYIYNLIWSIKEGVKRNYDKQRLSTTIYSTLISSYYYYLQYEEVFKKDKIFELLYEINDYMNLYELSEEEEKQILNLTIIDYLSNPEFTKITNQFISLEEYIKRIKEKSM